MTVFIYEHLTSGALLNEPFSASLMHEGDAMLRALTQDLLALDQPIQVMRDARLPALPLHPLLAVHTIATDKEYQHHWQQSLHNNPYAIVIAPETDSVLYKLVSQLEQYPIQHLGCSSTAIEVSSDKYLTWQKLIAQGISTPQTLTLDEWPQAEHNNDIWIIKPRDGAGCEHTYKFGTDELTDYVAGLSAEQRVQMIIQPYLPGENLSLSIFINNSGAELLSVNHQVIEETAKQLHLRHCLPGCEAPIAKQAIATLIADIRATIPGLWGFVGIDLILAEQKLWVIDINPRLTSSYAEADFRKQQNPALTLHQSIHA